MNAFEMCIDLRDQFMQKDKGKAVLDIIELCMILFPFSCLFVERWKISLGIKIEISVYALFL